MFGNITAREIYTPLRVAINEYMASSVLTEGFFLFILNSLISFIYRQHLWGWANYSETLTNSPAATGFTTTYRPRRIDKLWDTATEQVYKEFQIVGDTNVNTYFFTKRGKVLTLDQSLASIKVWYQRYPTKITSLDDSLDIPELFNFALYHLLLVEVLGPRLGEGMGQLVQNYYDLAMNDILSMKKDEEMGKIIEAKPNNFISANIG